MERIKNVLNVLLKQFAIIFLYIFISISLELLLYDFLTSNNPILEAISYLIVETTLLIIFIIIFRKKIIPDLKDFKVNRKKYIKENYKYWLYGLIVMAISNIIIGYFFGMASNEAGNRDLLGKLPILSILFMVIYAPIIEEAMTRIILKDTFPNIIYYILSGFIFGSLHLLSSQSLGELLYIIPYGALGYSFAVIYKKSNNIWSSIFFHALHNSIAVLIVLFL